MARYVLWVEAVKTIKEYPLTGVGFGNWLRIPIPYNAKTFDNAFNMFLTAGVEMGMVGMLLLAWVIFAPLIRGITMILKVDDTFWRHILMGLTASIVGTFVHGMVEDPVYMIFTNWVFGICIGLVYASANIIKAEQSAEGLLEAENDSPQDTKSMPFSSSQEERVRGAGGDYRRIPLSGGNGRNPVFLK